ncbi:MAG: hydrogenase maturation nickel metallochaperone HypA [Verrucomicrobia bacterium]|nr:hydrogenase maturation nickel metallochaperone HypA [Verrucomicrobiota bacterium]
MHEGNFTDQIVDAILGELEKYPNNRPAQVSVAVGEMLHLLPDSVQMHYQLRTQGTPLEGVKLILREVPVRVLCNTCGFSGDVEDHHLLMCSKCGARDVKMLSGNEITIDAIEIS